jgi:hypothetical protein
MVLGVGVGIGGCGDACEEMCHDVSDAFHACPDMWDVDNLICYEDPAGAFTGGNPAFRDCEGFQDFEDDCVEAWRALRDSYDEEVLEIHLDLCKAEGDAYDEMGECYARSPLSLL